MFKKSCLFWSDEQLSPVYNRSGRRSFQPERFDSVCNNLSCESYLLEKSQILRFINCTEYSSQLSFLQGFFVAGPRGRSGRKHHGKRWQHFNNHVLTTTYTNNKSLKPGLTMSYCYYSFVSYTPVLRLISQMHALHVGGKVASSPKTSWLFFLSCH